MIRLECTTGGHNKFYELHLLKTNGQVIAKALYGAIGNAPQENVFYNGDNEQEAIGEMQKKQLDKQKKGYVLVGSNGKITQAPTEKKTELPIIWPMNAVGVKDENHLNRLICQDIYVGQEKLDGMRAIIHITKTGLRIFSRSAGVEDPTRPLEKTTALPHLALLKFPHLADTILDAEILAPGTDMAELSGAIHSNEVGHINGQVKAFVFDVLKYCGQELLTKTLSQRIMVLDIIKTRLHSPYVTFLPWVYKATDKQKLFEEVLAKGGEGIMLKRLDAVYLLGGRPANNWYKMKKHSTFDCIAMGFTQGKGKYNNRIGALVFGQYVNDKLVELGHASGMSDSERTEMSNNPEKYIGKVVVIKGMERLRSGSIRHPQFAGIRYDKDPKDCKWYEGER
jgi:ATP-dependent DNA ligase